MASLQDILGAFAAGIPGFARLTEDKYNSLVSTDPRMTYFVYDKGYIMQNDVRYPSAGAAGGAELSFDDGTLTLTLTNADNTESSVKINITPASIGLGNVNNTADMDKPVSTAQQNALNLKEDKANKGAANGYAPLDAGSKVPIANLPDTLLGQVINGGTFDADTAVATLSLNAQHRLGTTDATITLTNDNTAITGFVDNADIFYITTVAGTFAGLNFQVGDWLLSIGTAWDLVKNSDAVRTVQGRTGDVVITASDVGVEAGAQVNIIETVQVNGAALSVSGKTVNVPVPTGALASKDAIMDADVASNAGIQGSKLSAAVQASLGKADTSLQPANIVTSLSSSSTDTTTLSAAALFTVLSAIGWQDLT